MFLYQTKFSKIIKTQRKIIQKIILKLKAGFNYKKKKKYMKSYIIKSLNRGKKK